jgi:dihydrodipicolinate synthase/N-acetylneuraminate lyase
VLTPDDRRHRLRGLYVTVPTPFRDDDLAIDFPAIQRHVRYLVDSGVTTGSGVLLAGGAAGDFSTMDYQERIDVAAAIVEAADGQVPIVMGAQTTSTRELERLARAAENVGAEFIQVSPPFYFQHTEDDFEAYVRAGAESADVGLVIYNTFWTSTDVSNRLLERLVATTNVAGLKWSMPDSGHGQFERVISQFSDRLSIIDNQMRYVSSHILGAKGIEVHPANYDPAWALRLWGLLEDHDYVEAQHEIVRVAVPFMTLWLEMEQYTSGDGYLDKLCMELVGLGSSRCRPPTRDVRSAYLDRARQFLEQTGVLPRPGTEPGKRTPVATIGGVDGTNQ